MHSNDIFNIQIQHEVIQVALKGLDTECASIEKKLKQEMSTLVLKNKNLQENYKRFVWSLLMSLKKTKAWKNTLEYFKHRYTCTCTCTCICVHILIMQCYMYMDKCTFEVFLI